MTPAAPSLHQDHYTSSSLQDQIQMAIDPAPLTLIVNALNFIIFTDLRLIRQWAFLIDFTYSHVFHPEYWSGITSTWIIETKAKGEEALLFSYSTIISRIRRWYWDDPYFYNRLGCYNIETLPYSLIKSPFSKLPEISMLILAQGHPDFHKINQL